MSTTQKNNNYIAMAKLIETLYQYTQKETSKKEFPNTIGSERFDKYISRICSDLKIHSFGDLSLSQIEQITKQYQ
jgi:hypothetical protein